MAVAPEQNCKLPPLQEFALRWLPPLLDATTPREVALAAVQAVRSVRGCTQVRILWDIASEGDPSTESSHPAAVSGEADDLLFARDVIGDVHPRMAAHQASLLGIPLRHSGAVVLLEMEHPDLAAQVIAAVSEQLQVADLRLRSAMQVAELQGSVARLEYSEQVQRALFAISDLAGSDRDMPELLKGIHAIVGALMYAENCFIVRLDAERDVMRFLYFVDVIDPPFLGDVPLNEREGTLTWYLLHDGKALRGDTAQLREQVSGPLRIVGTDGYDWMGVPLLRDGIVHGAIVVQSYEPGIVYTAADQALLEFVGSHILTALERKGNKEELERSVQQRTVELADANFGLQMEIIERQRAEQLQRALFVIAQLATADIGEDAFYRRIHEVVGELLNARNFFIALLSDDRRLLQFPYYADELDRIAPSRALGRGLSEYVLRHAQPLLGNTDFIVSLAATGEIQLASAGPPAVCWLGVPLMSGEEAIGLITVQSYDPEVVYGAADQELLGFVASQIANSLHRRRAALIQQQAFATLEERVQSRTHELRAEIGERERIENRLKHQVMHDALTNLPNRGYLRNRLNRILARPEGLSHRQCALLYLDIDRFKIINDSLGHLAGDEVLKEVARRLQGCVRDPDLVARLSGDEFVVLLDDADSATAIGVAQRVLDAIGRPVQVAGKSLTPTASVGIALGDSRHALADELVRDADTALYRAKTLGRNRYVLFDASLQRAAIDVLALEGELREGLQHDQFEPYFQPVVRLATGEVVGNEALLRWNHPTRGVLGPADFLQIAEDCGALEAIDWRMFEISCTLATKFAAGRFLTINVSPHHLRDEAFDTHLLGMIERSGMDPACVLIEVTEGSLLDDPARVRATLSRLRDAGVGAALDDFGTGYSSLSYLDSFPLRMLKIDRSFVVELGPNGKESSTSILIAILALARALGMNVVAEGIETEEQRSALLALGCEYGQGYLLGRPAPLAHWLALQEQSADDDGTDG
ncbi:MAG: EAL domain-containing protein [Pseudomonadota bacterium]|nr:EAL domain-containing protein [Pseudomonadota bacterium]